MCTVIFNSGEDGPQTGIWSTTPFFRVQGKIDAIVNVRQKLLKLLCRPFSSFLTFTLLQTTLLTRIKASHWVSQAFPETFDCVCSQSNAAAKCRRTYLQCPKIHLRRCLTPHWENRSGVLFERSGIKSAQYCWKGLLWTIQSEAWPNYLMLYGSAMLWASTWTGIRG